MMIDGPRMPPASRAKPKQLIVLLHGYGSNGEDLISLAPYWAKTLPDAQFVSPNAPEPVPGYPGGYQWFPITKLDPRLMEQGARAASGALDRFLDRELERYGLAASSLALVGFSQGTMMSLHVGLRRKQAPAAILGFSGALVSGEKLKDEMTAKPPILLVHGDRDDMVPVTALFDAGEGLAEAGHGAQWMICPGLGHSIAPEGLAAGGAFLKAALAGKFRALA